MDTDLKDRTREFALRIVRLCSSLPSSRTSTAIGGQLPRAKQVNSLKDETNEWIAIFVSPIKRWRSR